MKKNIYKQAATAVKTAIMTLMFAIPAHAAGMDNTFLGACKGTDAAYMGNRNACQDTLISEGDIEWPANIKERINRLLEDDMFQTSMVGMMVYDLTADSAIFKYNEKQLMRPASTLKMIVAVAALDMLGHDYKYKTVMGYTGQAEANILEGDIYCKGDFDPVFGSSDLKRLVDCIKESGIDTIRGNLYADVSMKDPDRLGEGWCWDDDNPELSPLLISGKDEFMQAFKERLEREGVAIEGTIEKGDMPDGCEILCTIYRPISEILPQMMKESDNLYSESLFYHIAKDGHQSAVATAKKGRKVKNRMIEDFGMKPSKYYIADGSGLSLYNYVSPELEICFLKYAYKNKDIYPYLLDSMPIAGIDGTLKKRMRQGYANGNVHAKTGTLTGVNALAGYCTAANGHVLCFSIINMGIRHASTGRRFQDLVCEALCRP